MDYFETILTERYKSTISKDLSRFILGFLEHLRNQGYSEGMQKQYLFSITHFMLWHHHSGLAETDIDFGTVEQFKLHRCQCPGNRRARNISTIYANRVRRFVEFLGEQGFVSKLSKQTRLHTNSYLDDYAYWLRQHVGLVKSTIRRHTDIITRLLLTLGRDSKSYDAFLVRNVLMADLNGRSSSDCKSIVTALRSYLRFLTVQGTCCPGLDQAIPKIPQWRLSSLPRYLPSEQIERIITACDIVRPAGLRDRAILLLLARLGLRAGDIANLSLNDINWNDGTIRVIGKGRREARLPLPQDVGDAVFTYLEKSRPVVPYLQIFLRSMAPYQPLSKSSVVSRIVLRAINRAGITNAPSYGANLLRHSAATNMLQSGATLEVIGTILRHKSLDTTAHYAKVDIKMLRQVVQPWPGGEIC